MPADRQPVVVVLCVGLTARLVPMARRIAELARRGWQCSLIETIPAVTCTVQATFLTGTAPDKHGIVANGWLYRDTMEVRFWQQSNRLIQAEPLYVTAKQRAQRRGQTFRCAKLFWWFNQGADVEYSVTPKPYYGADGSKVFGITGRPEHLTQELESALGRFPFETFWGPTSGYPCTDWIARCAVWILERYRPDLTLVYLPHLDYDLLRYGPSRADLPRLLGELDCAFARIQHASNQLGARLVVVSEYGHLDVRRPIYINRVLRQHGYLRVRPGPFGEQLENFESLAFGVCDHQICHLYIREPEQVGEIADLVAKVPGVARVLVGEARAELNLDHPRSGDLVLLAEPDSWFAYPFWLDDKHAPDYARTVDIHRKPGFDPCELFFDPQLWWPKGRLLWRLLQRKLGFRVLFDVIPLDASLVGGSHGVAASEPLDRPVLISDGPSPGTSLPMTAFRDWLLNVLGLPD